MTAPPIASDADMREPTDDELREGVKAFQHAYASDDPLADWRAFWWAVRSAMQSSAAQGAEEA